MIAAFIDGRLEGEERQTAIEHLSNCSECRDVFQTANEYEEMTASDRRSWLIPAAFAAAAAIAGAVFLGPAIDKYQRPRNLKALHAGTAELPERVMSARPSIDMAYKGVFRGSEDKLPPSALLTPAANLEEAARKRPTAENLHAAGIAYLLIDDDEAALESLQRAARLSTPSAALLNDLAAAYYETRDEANAKATIDRAWQLEKIPVIAWTRAVILDSEQAWKDYLALDSISEWAEEAKLQIGN